MNHQTGSQHKIRLPLQFAGCMMAALLPFTVLSVVFLNPPGQEAHAGSMPAHRAAKLDDIDVNSGFAELVSAVRPAVVNISVTGKTRGEPAIPGVRDYAPEFEEFFKRFFGFVPEGWKPDEQTPYLERKTTAVGSGFVIDPAGLVVTNHHVIEDAEEIEVVLDNGTRIPATLRGADEKTDLALLEIKTTNPLPFVVFGDSDQARVGDWVIAIGNPFGLGGTTTSGIISARGRDIRSGLVDDFIQIDAPINQGNSGGPLFNTLGEVIGVNSAIYSPNGGNIGIGFAIPSSLAGNVIEQLRKTGTVERGYLGVQIQEVSADIADNLDLNGARGALVTSVVPDSPAEQAGIEVGDVILSFDGKPIEQLRDLPKIVARTMQGNNVEITIWRNQNTLRLNAQVGESRTKSIAETDSGVHAMDQIGLVLENSSRVNLQHYGLEPNTSGLVIVGVTPGGEADRRGLKAGDLIKRINQKEVSTPEEFRTILDETRQAGKDTVLLLVQNRQLTRFVAVSLDP